MSALYVLKEAITGFRRAKLATLGSVVTITLSLLLLGIYYVVSTNTSRIVQAIRQRIDMEAFLDDPLPKGRGEEIRRLLVAIPGVDRIQFISKDEAAKIFKEEFGEDVNAVLNFNPLPASFKIFLKDDFRTSEKAASVQNAVKAIKGVDKVVYRRELLELIDKQARVIDAIGLGLGLLIGFSAIFLVSNTIRLMIYAKRKAVETMKLVGASRAFIRAPFIIEGVLQGSLGGLIAMGIIYYALTFAANLVSPELADFLRIDGSFYYLIVIAGICLGVFGSAISIKRFIGESIMS